MAISGAFAGLAGGLDMLGYLYHFGTGPSRPRRSASSGSRLRCSAGTPRLESAWPRSCSAACSTAPRTSSSGTIDPSLAGHLTEMIQGLVVLFVGADVLILAVWNSRRKLKRRQRTPDRAPEPEAASP